jgi:hypothetical protein
MHSALAPQIPRCRIKSGETLRLIPTQQEDQAKEAEADGIVLSPRNHTEGAKGQSSGAHRA